MSRDKTQGQEVLARDDKALAHRVYTLGCLNRIHAHGAGQEDRELVDKCLRFVLSDSRVHYLAMRTSLDSAFNNAVLVAQIVRNCIRVIRQTRPTRLISSSPPHSLHSWLLAKCFECIGLPVYILERSPVNDRAWICEGTDTHRVVERAAESQPGTELSDTTKKLIETQRLSAPGKRDKDGFYLSRMDLGTIKGANTNTWWSWRREASWLLSGKFTSLPLRLASTLRKKQLYGSYASLARNSLPQAPYVVYFMHYQPERSSVPDGLFFGQQWLAIEMLSAGLPAGWELVVREHPTTWFKPFDLTVRRRGFYRDLIALGNVSLSSMEADTFALIDGSQAVATLTGSVGFQALMRNRPVLSLGLPPYKDHPACLPVGTSVELAEALGQIQSGALAPLFSDAALAEYFTWVEHNSVRADPAETDWMKARIKNFTHLYGEILSGASPIDQQAPG